MERVEGGGGRGRKVIYGGACFVVMESVTPLVWWSKDVRARGSVERVEQLMGGWGEIRTPAKRDSSIFF